MGSQVNDGTHRNISRYKQHRSLPSLRRLSALEFRGLSRVFPFTGKQGLGPMQTWDELPLFPVSSKWP